jgi:Kef-type K+ transport system membrane component KefB
MLSYTFPQLPFKEPVLVFTLLLSIILIAPILFRKFRIPGIVGLIVSGMIIGPHALNLVEFGESIKLLSTAGLLYLMFLAGLELNPNEMMRSRNKSLVFGSLTFLVPLATGFVVAHYFLDFPLLASLLIASMFSTHTLISYPIVSRLGITRSEAVSITIGGTIITDTAVLVMLALISAAAQGSLNLLMWIRMILSIAAFSFLILWGVPRLSRWFFRNLQGESGSQYIYVLTILFISGLLARVAGIEPIIGAFLAGLAISSLIPHTSALMNRISFIGNNLFIPVFLLSVGLMVDFPVLFEQVNALVFSGILVIVALVSKYLAAWAMQKIYKYSFTERMVIFGLSVSHAAAIIAVVIVGYDLKLIGPGVLNGAILIILVSCLASSFITERYGRRLAVSESEKKPVPTVLEEKILVSVANPATIETLVDFAILIQEPEPVQPVLMLSVVPDDEDAEEQILRNNKMFESAITHAAAADTQLSLISRVDLNVSSGIVRAVKELMINRVVLGWNGKMTTSNFFFGSIVENLIANTSQMVLVVKSAEPMQYISRIVVTLPQNAEFEAGFLTCLSTLTRMAVRTNSKLLFTGFEKTLEEIRNQMESAFQGLSVEYSVTRSIHPITEKAGFVNENDLYVVVAARKRTLSYSHFMDHMPRDLARSFADKNFLVIYPEQRSPETGPISTSLESTTLPVSDERPNRYTELLSRERRNVATGHNSRTE